MVLLSSYPGTETRVTSSSGVYLHRHVTMGTILCNEESAHVSSRRQQQRQPLPRTAGSPLALRDNCACGQKFLSPHSLHSDRIEKHFQQGPPYKHNNAFVCFRPNTTILYCLPYSRKVSVIRPSLHKLSHSLRAARIDVMSDRIR